MPRKIWISAFAFVLLLALSAAWWNQSHTVMERLAQQIGQSLSDTIGQTVKIGQIKIISFNELALTQVEIDDPQGEPILVTQQINVVFSLWDLLRSEQPAIEMIKKITLTVPKIFLAEGKDGKWNIDELLQGKKTSQSSLRSLLQIDQGEIVFRLPQGTWVLKELAGTVDLANQPAVEIGLTAMVEGQKVELQGAFTGMDRLNLTMTSPQVDLLKILPIFADKIPADQVQLLAGELGSLTLVVKKEKEKLTFAGESELHNIAFAAEGQEIQNVNGFLTFTSEKVNLYGTTARFADQPFTVSGEVQIDGAEPVLNMAFISHHTNLAVLPLNQDIAGQADLNLKIIGPLSQPEVTGTVNVNQVSAAGYQAEHAYGRIHFADQRLTVRDFSLRGFGGNLSGQGSFDLANKQAAVTLSGWHIDTGSLAGELGLPLTGYADFTASASGPFELQGLELAAQMTMEEGTLKGLSFQKLTLAATKNREGFIVLQQAAAEVGGGTVAVAGTVQQGKIDGSLLVKQVDVAPFAAQYGQLPVAGRMTLVGKVNGDLSEPVFTGRLLGEQGQIAAQPFDSLDGAVHLSKEKISFDNVQTSYRREIEKGKSELFTPDLVTKYRINGSINLQGTKNMDITASLTHGRAEDLVALLAPGEKLTGNVEADLRLTGTLDQPDAFMAVNFSEGSYRGYLVRRAEALLQHHQGVTTVDHLSVRALPANLELSGTIDAAKQMNFAVDIKNIRLNRLFVELPYPIAGRGDFTGQLTGTPESPVFSGELTAKNLKVKGQEFTGVLGHVILDKQNLTIPDLEFHQGDGVFRLRGGLDLVQQTLSGTVELINGQVSHMMPFVDMPADQVTGLMNGQIQAVGPWKNPTVFLKAELTQGTIKHYPLDHIDVDLTMENHVVTVNDFKAKQGKGQLIVTGAADLNGQVKLNLFGNQIDSGLFTAWYDSKISVHGETLISIELTGDVKAPQAAVSIGVTNGSIQDESFDLLSGSFIVTNNLIDINQITLTKDNYVASATGKIPMRSLLGNAPLDKPIHLPTHFSQISNKLVADDELDVKVLLDQADLSALPIFTKRVAWAGGKTQGTLFINGTPDSPKLYGSFSVADGTVKFSDLKEPLKNLSIDIQLEGDKIVVKSFQGKLGGGSFQLDGSASLKGRSLDEYAFGLQLNQLEIDHRNFKGPISGSLKLTPKEGKPFLAGKILFERDQIDVPAIPEFSKSDFNMGLDVTVEAGKKLRFYNSFMYDFYVEGKVNFGGTLQQPAPTGKFTVSRGQITYFTAPFKIQSASAEFTPYNGLIPVIKLTSQFEIQQVALAQQTTVTLAVNGLATNMDFRLTANPAMSQEAILSLLTLRSRYFERQGTNTFGRDQVDSVVSSGLEAQLFSPVENTLKDFFGVDDFHIVHSTDIVAGDSTATRGARDIYNVELSKYLTDRFSINFSRGVDNSSQRIGFRYQFNEHVSTGMYYDSVKKTQMNVLTRYSF